MTSDADVIADMAAFEAAGKTCDDADETVTTCVEMKCIDGAVSTKSDLTEDFMECYSKNCGCGSSFMMLSSLSIIVALLTWLMK